MSELMTAPLVQRGHSAVVEMTLSVEGSSYRVSHSGPDYLILEKAAVHPPSVAEFRLEIDGKEFVSTFFLPDGIRAGESRVRTEPPKGGTTYSERES
jgi:hypothetical protein